MNSRRQRYVMPDYFRDALVKANVADKYEARPPYQRNDYIGWIERAKRLETRQKRIAQMINELERGDVYMKMYWGPGGK